MHHVEVGLAFVWTRTAQVLHAYSRGHTRAGLSRPRGSCTCNYLKALADGVRYVSTFGWCWHRQLLPALAPQIVLLPVKQKRR